MRRGWGRAPVLVLAVVAAAAAAQTGPGTDETEALLARLGSPLERERAGAIERLATLASPELAARALARLKSGDPLARLAASRLLGRIAGKADLSAMAAAFAGERDRLVQRAMARAICRFDDAGVAAVAGAGVAEGSRSHRLYVREHVLFSLHRIIDDETESGGEFKGFYEGQFARLTKLGAVVDPVLEALARNEGAAIILRRAAIRAMGELDRPDVAQRLLAVRKAYLRSSGLQDVERLPGWRVGARGLQDYFDDRFLAYLDYALAQRGWRRGLVRRIQYHQRQAEGYKRGLKFATPDLVADYRSAIASELFSVAYCYGRLKEFANATRHYLIVGVDYRDTVVAPTAYYNLACMESLRGRVDEALGHLETAIEIGYLDSAWIYRDNDLRRLRQDPRFTELMARFGFAPPPGVGSAGDGGR